MRQVNYRSGLGDQQERQNVRDSEPKAGEVFDYCTDVAVSCSLRRRPGPRKFAK